MRILLFAVLALMVFAPVLATEYQRNPDHLPSIAFSAGYGHDDGSQDFIGLGTTIDSTNTQSEGKNISAFLKAPVSDSITLFGGFGLGRSTFHADETPLFLGSRGNSHGWGVSVGFIKYFGR